MSRQEVGMIHCYRVKHGDVDVPVVPYPMHNLDEAKNVVGERLINHFHDKRFRPGRKPHTADLVGEDGRVIARFQVRPDTKNGGETVVEIPVADRT